MKFRNIVTGLIAACVIFFVIIQGIDMPRTVQTEQQDVSTVPDPLTQDFGSISKYRNEYMGNASNLTGLFYELPLNDLEMSFKLHPDTFAAEVNYKAEVSGRDRDIFDRALIYNATAAFALIDNLEAVTFNFVDSSFKIFREDVEKWYGIGLKALSEEASWKKKVQDRLKDADYIKYCLKAIVAYEGRSAAETLTDFYGNTGEPIIIYDEMPFEEGMLVLAEKLTDGEHYPDLHFIDDRGKVEYLTRGSYCWTLNYTEFKGHYIYFGLAGVETRQYGGDQIPVEKLEALFPDRIASVIPREEVIEHINPMEKDTRTFNNPQGYIMLVEGRDIPADFISVLKNGERKSVSGLHIERSLEHMPEYLKSKQKEIYNSFAFTFTPMLTPVEWSKGFIEGEICLEGSTDGNGNRNALYLRPAGHMSFFDSFILPRDIKPLYLSDNYPRTAAFSMGETVAVKYPAERELVDCRILKLTREKVEKEIGQDSLEIMETIGSAGDNVKLTLPGDKGYYLFLLRTKENDEIQTYTGILNIK